MLKMTEGKTWKHHGIRSPRMGGGEGYDLRKTTYQQDKEMTFWFQKSVQPLPDKTLFLNSSSGTLFNQKKKWKITISIGIDLRTCFLVTWAIHSFEIINHSFLPEEEIRGSLLPIKNLVSSCLPHVRLAETS